MYKYMTVDVAPLFAKTLKVRFTQPSELNDPFEFRPLIDSEGTAEEFRELIDARITEMFGTVDGALSLMEKQQAIRTAINKCESIRNVLPRLLRVGSNYSLKSFAIIYVLAYSDPNYPSLAVPIRVFRKMIATNPGLGQQFMAEMQRHKTELLESITKAALWEAQWEKLQQALGQSVGIFSLTEDLANILMWSHYASQHSGIVVEFDENDQWFDQRVTPNDEFRHLVRVAYLQNPIPCTWGELNGADILYTKNAEWAYEREWRLIRPLKDGTEVSPGKFCFDVFVSAIRRIIFGCRTTPDLEGEIRTSVAAHPTLTHVIFTRVTLVAGGKIRVGDAEWK
ncbi:MAG: DUF2971 domain-containing protein [Terriglobia bacterium]